MVSRPMPPRSKALRVLSPRSVWALTSSSATLALLCMPLVSCVREIEVPYVGDCADYPVDPGPYDYGDFSIGDCLSAPTDLQFYQGPDGPVLLVVNSNGYMVFGDGSVLSYDWNSLETLIDAARVGDDPLLEANVPPVILTSDPALERSALPTPYYVGKLATASIPVDGDQHPVAFVSGRLSLTTDLYKNDHVYAIDLADPLNLARFDVETKTSPSENWAIEVLEDPYGLAFARTDKGSYLFTVNQSDHSISVIDTAASPMQALTGSTVGLVTWPGQDDFEDVGVTSFAEVGNLAVGNAIVTDNWKLTYLEGVYRLFFVGQEDGKGVLGYADAIDGTTFTPGFSEPILTAGSADSWDSDGVGRSSLLLAPSSDATSAQYILLYEGWRRSETLGLLPRIGIARSASSTPLSFSKDNLQEEDLTSDDFILNLGAAGTFDERGLSAPWVFSTSTSAVVWYTGIDAAGKRSLGGTAADLDDISQWDAGVQFTFTNDAGEEQRDATGFFDISLDRYRLWFVREDQGVSCLSYAESSDGETFTVGGFDGGTADCLALESEAIIRSPSIFYDGRLMRMWYATAADEVSAPWTLHEVMSFDGFRWRPAGTGALDFELDWFTGPPSPVVTLPSTLTTSASARLEGENVRDGGSGFPTQELVQANGLELSFSLLHGHVLGVGSRDRVVALTTEEEDAGETVTFNGLSWDSFSVLSPAYDLETQTLYYAGVQAPEDADATARELSVGTAIGVAAQEGSLAIWRNSPCYQFPLPADVDCKTMPTERTYGDPDVVHEGGKVWLFFASASVATESTETGTGQFTRIQSVQRAESASTFDESSVRVVLEPDIENGETDLLAPAVVPPVNSGDRWHLWFTSVASTGRRIGYASSVDGITWERVPYGTWALELGVGGDWDDSAVEAPTVYRDAEGGWHMWYAGSSGNEVYRIGYATATQAEGQDVSTLIWTRHLVNGQTTPVLLNSFDWWDAYSITQPDVVWVGDRYRMWYEGSRNGEHRIGLAESLDGSHWFKVFEPLSTGDYFKFSTRLVNNEDNSTGLGLQDGVLDLDVTFGSYLMCGNGVTEIAVSPDGGIAAISALYTPGIYIMDTRDDSSDTFFDDNYLGFEAAVGLQDSSGCGPDETVRGTRSLMFSPSGDRIYATTKVPDSVLVIDRTQIVDKSVARLIKDDVVIGSIELEPGSAEDQGSQTTGDIGPIGLAMTQDGRYLWVANGNGNSVYTIDLSLGGVGEVVAVARNVGELPSALALSPDERYLMVANYVGEVEVKDEKDGRGVPHAFIAVIDADPTSETFGAVVAQLKNLELPAQ